MRDRAKQDEGFTGDKASPRHREQFVSSCRKIETRFIATVVLHQRNTVRYSTYSPIPTNADYNRGINNTVDQLRAR